MPPNGSAISFTTAQPTTSSSTIEQEIEQDAADPARQAGALGRRDHAHHAQHQQLTVGRRRAAELLGGGLEVARAALGQRQRGLRHPAQLQALLRARGGDRGAEVLARAFAASMRSAARVPRMACAAALNRVSFEQLLVGAALELLHRSQSRLGLHADLSGLGRHGLLSLWRGGIRVAPGRRRAGSRAARARDRARRSRPGAMSFGAFGWNSAARQLDVPAADAELVLAAAVGAHPALLAELVAVEQRLRPSRTATA